MEDRRDGFLVDFTFSSPVAVRHFPVESVSLSIDTMEKTFQGLGLWFFLPLTRGENRCTMQIRLTSLPRES